MPGKSRRRRGKPSYRSKERIGRPEQPVAPAREPSAAKTVAPVASPHVSVKPVRAPASTAKSVFQHTHIATELKTIGILAGIMLVILVGLALVLS